MDEPFALTIAYSFCEVLAPVLVVALGARIYGFHREWQVLVLSYVFIPVTVVFLDLVLQDMKVAARTTYLADTPVYPTSYAFDLIRFSAIFLIPLMFTLLHIRDPHNGR